MATANLLGLDAWDAKSGAANVIVETVQGSRNKFKYEPATGTIALSKVLPRGAVFPFDFGFIPSTLGDDGDPLDVLVLMDTPTFPGCRIRCRLIGVLEAEQVEHGQKERNDRLIAVAEKSHDHKEVRSVKDLSPQLLKEIEHFFVSYNDMEGRQFKPRSWRGPHRARKLAERGAERFQEQAPSADEARPAQSNGRLGAGKAR